MNADLHMAGELKATGKGNLFVIFGEPDIEILSEENGTIRVKVNGVDVFDPSTGESAVMAPKALPAGLLIPTITAKAFSFAMLTS
ncbi:hypothetical protein [Nitrosomonas communis]|uniref:Adenine-specific DNA-methyltransferase n=1 Tax=Nitrosomonas communis TaxID=44574 RepID=A0A1I4IV01_9PROT|nr:hypothetical protein [Nitrosomonas communis]SFL58172.1 adenine-specific DNA-methyltransferase [Nitrosomonas communis]